jgi:hypothetical protein
MPSQERPSLTDGGNPKRRGLLLAAQACAIAAGTAIFALHFLRRDLVPYHRFVSEYAVDVNGTRWGWLMQAVFLLLAVTSMILANAGSCAPQLPTNCRKPLALLLGSASVGTLVMFACRTDLNVLPFVETPIGKTHDVASVITFLSALAAMAVVALLSSPRPSAGLLLLAVAASALLVHTVVMLAQPRPYLWVGVTERILIAALITWCFWLAGTLCFSFHNRGVAGSTAGPPFRG